MHEVNIPADATALQVLALAVATNDQAEREPQLGAILNHPVTRALAGQERGYARLGESHIGPFTLQPAPGSAEGAWMAVPTGDLASSSTRVMLQGKGDWVEESEHGLRLRGLDTGEGHATPAALLRALVAAYDGDPESERPWVESVLCDPYVQHIVEPVYRDVNFFMGPHRVKRLGVTADDVVTLVLEDGTTMSARMRQAKTVGLPWPGIVSAIDRETNIEGMYDGCAPMGSFQCVELQNGAQMTLRPVAMEVPNPSEDPEQWKAFAGMSISDSQMDGAWEKRLRHFMRLHNTEALTDGRSFYTLVGSHLCECRPLRCGLKDHNGQVVRFLSGNDTFVRLNDRPLLVRWCYDVRKGALVAAQAYDADGTWSAVRDLRGLNAELAPLVGPLFKEPGSIQNDHSRPLQGGATASFASRKPLWATIRLNPSDPAPLRYARCNAWVDRAPDGQFTVTRWCADRLGQKLLDVQHLDEEGSWQYTAPRNALFMRLQQNVIGSGVLQTLSKVVFAERGSDEPDWWSTGEEAPSHWLRTNLEAISTAGDRYNVFVTTQEDSIVWNVRKPGESESPNRDGGGYPKLDAVLKLKGLQIDTLAADAIPEDQLAR